MAAEKDPSNLKSTGVLQQRRGDKGQYVYWMTMRHPKPETVAAHGAKVPEEFTRPEFIDLGVEVHTACGAPSTELGVQLYGFWGLKASAARRLCFSGAAARRASCQAQSESQAAPG
mgnify:CR=1 FL=1